jgi:hypothetical protein
MINNPHIVWNASEVAAGMKFGRSGGISSGSYYVIGTGASNNFFINKDGAIASPVLNINSSGNASFSGTVTAPTFSGSLTGNASTATSATTAGGAFGMPFIGSAITGLGSTDSWDARPTVGYAAFAINNHTGVTLSGYPGYGGVRLYASGYPTHSGSILRLEASDSVKTFGGLYSDGSPVLVQNTSISYGFGLNDTKLYLRTNGDNNHFLWNAADDWEELVAYSGTGFRIAASNGTTLATFTTSAFTANGTLNCNLLNTGNVINIGYTRNGTESIATSSFRGIEWHNPGGDGYYIGKPAGAWTQPLNIAFYTGIRYGANLSYNGHRWYNSTDFATITASINDGDNNMRGYYDIIAYASDKRLKHNVKPIENALLKVTSLVGMTYEWNNIGSQYGWSPDTQIREAGVFAQDVQAVLPEAVKLAPFDNDNGFSKSGKNFLTVKYEKIVPLLIEAFKEQQLQIEELKSIINDLAK